MNAIARLVDVSVPRSVAVPCPKAKFEFVRVAEKCLECDHFRGFVQVEPMPPARFDQAMRVDCAHPIARRLTQVPD